jgi:hypothetical protein
MQLIEADNLIHLAGKLLILACCKKSQLCKRWEDHGLRIVGAKKAGHGDMSMLSWRRKILL